MLAHNLGAHAQRKPKRRILSGDTKPFQHLQAGLDTLHNPVVDFDGGGVTRNAGRCYIIETAFIVDVSGTGLQSGGSAADVGIPLTDHSGRIAVQDHIDIRELKRSAVLVAKIR
mgnify:CR=1 FL=1